jgi:energy-coupling factor transporter ATP-binding protein EcfA2
VRLTREQLHQKLANEWKQGEHVGVFGPTGSGKTWLVSDIAGVRGYVVVLGIKRYDETLERFLKMGYKRISSWPPEYIYNYVVLWIPPKSLTPDREQAKRIHRALNNIYCAGGWTLVIDDAGYISAQLGLYRDIGVILNQGRSSYLSCVIVSTQIKSIAGRLPTETLKQIRHRFLFKVSYDDEIKALSAVCGVNRSVMVRLLSQLQDIGTCLYIDKNQQAFIVEKD